MNIDEYFDFLSSNDIRIKGHRIGIETVLYDFLYRSRTPDEILQNYPSLSLEKIYATILYYYQNKDRIDRYIAEWIEYGEEQRRIQEANPTPAMIRLRKIREVLEKENPEWFGHNGMLKTQQGFEPSAFVLKIREIRTELEKSGQI